MIHRGLILSVGGALLLGTGPGDSEELEFAPRQVIDKRFPAIKSPPRRPAGKARMRDDELLIGVLLNGEACAYPINMLTGPTREIINDKVGGRAIAATW